MKKESNTNTNPTLGTPSEYAIPENINGLSPREAAEFYVNELGFAIHPLYPSDKGTVKERGKKPFIRDWPNHKRDDVTEDFLDEHFRPGSTNNIGVVVEKPWVTIDLDSKPDKGESVGQWLDAHPELGGVPRESTGGGAHLHFICDDVPDTVLIKREALTSKLNEKTNAELFFARLNLVLSPSIHPSGHKYRWEVTGTVPRVKWADLSRIFGFEAPKPKKQGRPPKEKPWWGKYPEDLSSLDLVAVAEELGLLGKCLDDKDRKYAIRCPWAEEHSDGNVRSAPGSDTVIFDPADTFPAVKCLHAHCSDRGLEQFLEFAEAQKPGIVAANCTRRRVWQPGSTDVFNRPQLVLPGNGKPVRAFAKALGENVAKCRELFRMGGRVVEVVSNQSKDLPGCTLSSITPAELVTAIESCVEVGYLSNDDNDDSCFIADSMDEKLARLVLSSRAFRDQLPEIRRVLNVPIPMIDIDGEIVMPEPGYDDRFLTWLDPGAPVVEPMSRNDAIVILADLLSGHKDGGFWWKDEEARTLALARLLTPYCRGLMDFKRGPCWIFDGNRPGVGKDTLANITIVLFTGHSLTGAAPKNDDEMRKRITTNIRAGAQFFHIANLKGELDYPSLEAATDASGVWEDRLLGSNTQLRLMNEVEYSISANGAVWTPDIQRRSRVIELHCGLEDLGSHQYRHSDILGLVAENRSKILSALHALVQHWDRRGRPSGPTPFSSFPQWGDVVGGILTACGFLDPCRPQAVGIIGGDQSTRVMAEFFQLAHEEFGDAPVRKEVFQQFIKSTAEIHELFDEHDFATAGGLSKFGRHLMSFTDRTLGGVAFSYHATSRNHGIYRVSRIGMDSSPPNPFGPSKAASAADHRGEEGYKGFATADSAEWKKSSAIDKDNPEISSLEATKGSSIPGIPVILQRDCSTEADLKAMAGELLLANAVAVYLRFPPTKKHTTPATAANPEWLTLQKLDGTIWRVDLRTLREEPKLAKILRRILCGGTIVTHDAGIVIEWCIKHLGLLPSKVRCIRTAFRLLTNGNNESDDSLNACIQRFLLPVKVDDRMPIRPTLTKPADRLKHRSGDGSASLHQLASAAAAGIDLNGLTATWELENDVLPAVIAMKVNGIYVNRVLVEEMAGQGNQQAKSLLPHIDTETDRIHSNFDPLGIVTGRISSCDPALQNIERGPLRTAFTAQDGFCLVGGDYANIDVRVLAAEAGDEAMIAAFNEGVDFHRKSAAAIFNKHPDEVTPEERKVAKLLLLGLINGQNSSEMIHSALKRGVKIDEETAKRFHAMIMQDYPGIWERYERLFSLSKKRVTEIRTRIGRRRLVSADLREKKLRGLLLNTPIQGGTADGVKRAMVLLLKRLPAGARLVLIVHDELIIECPVGMAEEVKTILIGAMIDGMQSIHPEVCIDVEAGIWRTWADKGNDFIVP